MWKVVFTKQAAKDAKKLKAAGLDGKTKKLIDVVRKTLLQPITVQDKPPMNFGGEHSAHCLRYGQAPRGRRSGASGWPSAPAPKRARGVLPPEALAAPND